ncbi:MAG: hypothetical protein WBE34_12305 [Candidatus Nitrosopolaris sp.]
MNHRISVAVPILSAALLSMSLIVSSVMSAEAQSEDASDNVGPQQSGTQSSPTNHNSYGNQQQSGTQSNPTKHDNYGKHQQSGIQDNSHHSGKHTHDKARTNQEINQLNQCTNGASCWNYAQNILCVHSTCIFGAVTPFLMPKQY